jgi:teichuronic acid biosynthesis glycosyltransferase TuaH
MLQNRDIVCVSNTSWFGKYAKSTVQLLERLAEYNRVLFVEYPYTWKDIYATLRGYQQAPVKRMLRIDNPLTEIETNVGTKVYNLVLPPNLPLFFLKSDALFNLFFPINVLLYKNAVRRAMRKLAYKDVIVITAYNPIYGNALVGKLNEKSHIYYCYDGVESVFFGERIFEIEQAFMQKVDGIITTSDYLKNEKSKFNPKCFVVKNGVDFPVFSKYAKQQIHSNSHKKVGFIGSLDPRFDIDTVEFAVKALPDFVFEFTGDMRNSKMKSRLEMYSNVHFYPPVQPNDVPQLLAQYDVGIIPYIMNDVNKNIYPLKINEYLAVGVPVVMNAFATLPDFVGFVSVSNNKNDFIQMLRWEVENDSATKIKARIDFASKNSWEARTNDFANIIDAISIENPN